MVTISVQHTPQNGTRFNCLDLATRARTPAPACRPNGQQLKFGVAAARTGLDHRGGQHPSANGDHSLVEALAGSKIFHEYERAFSEATGLPLTLRPTETWQLPLHGKRNESPLCCLMSQKSRTCAACLQVQQKLSETATHEARTVVCPAGLSDTAVPVRLGNRLIGFLQTGQVFRKQPTETQFEHMASLLEEWGVDVNRAELRKAYFGTRVVPNHEHDAMIKLLSIFAQHLSIVSNQLAVQRDNAEPPAIIRAKQYIQEHQAEDLRLEQVAKAVNMSHFYFCKMFRKVVGLNFTDYLARVRIEKAKNLLLNPNLRVSEIAYEIGFQSLTHFNRVFKRILGLSPSDYRQQLLGT
jgi:AraC-like DNA-binding protein/ligand-binding sensor protein